MTGIDNSSSPKIWRRIVLAVALALGLHSAPRIAHAWGHLKGFNEEWRDAYLIQKALERSEILYCLDPQNPADFPATSLAAQVEAAMSLWLNAIADDHPGTVQVRQVPCTDHSFNLRIFVGPESQYKTLGSYQLESLDGERWYSLVKINTDFRDRDDDGTSVAIVDFSALLARVPLSFDEAFSTLRAQPMLVSAFADLERLSYVATFWSSYRSFVHEFGHSFGLCDTYGGYVEKDCDPHFRSDEQPSSIMKDSRYFYLTEDDREGVRRLVQRFRSP